MTCFGITLGTFTPMSLSPTSPPSPTETLFPVTTNTAVIATPTVASTVEEPFSGQVNVIEINGFKDETDHWYFYGLVRNDTNRPIYDLQIEVKLIDSAGIEVYTYTINTLLNYLTPGETSPFSDFTADPFPDGQTMQATVVSFSHSISIKHANLEFRGITLWVDEYNDLYLAGEVFNGSADPVEINAIAGSLSDETNTFVTASSAYPFLGYLEPNGSGPFVMMFDAPIGEADSLTNYTLYSDALVTNPTSIVDISLSDKQNDYQDTIGNFHLAGSVTNNSAKPINIHLVAGAYDANGNCLDANSVYLPLPVNSGETLPYDFTIWGALDFVQAAYDAAIHYKIYIDWLSTYEVSSQAYSLPTIEDTNSINQGVAVYTGTVINNSGQDLYTTIVIVAIYDKLSGELIATNYAFVPEFLPNNGTGFYELSLFPPIDIDPQNIDIIITALGQ